MFDAPGEMMHSALQIRFGGTKGMVSLDTRLEGRRLRLRPSQIKFASDECSLEVNEVARCLPGHLNREVIMLLSTRGVPDHTLLTFFQREAQRAANTAIEDGERAPHEAALLEHSSPEPGGAAAVAMEALQLPGGPLSEDPHLRAIVLAVRLHRLELLRSKCHLPVENSRLAHGVLDERGVLRENQMFLRERYRIPGTSEYYSRVITGRAFFVRNPCLHAAGLRFVDR